MNFKSHIREIRKGNSDLKLEEQIGVIQNVIQNMEKESKYNNPKQMLQRLTIPLAQVKAGNTFENLLNEIRQIICSLY